jgi:membrane-bound serine protease (ClpP class)
MIGTFVTGDLGTSEGQYQLWAGIATVITSAFGAGMIIWLLSRQFHSVRVLDRVILKSELGPNQATPAGLTVLEAAASQRSELQPGDLGVAHTGLRPAGRAAFGARIMDVQSLGGFIEKGIPVRIVSIGKYVIEVEEADE